MQYRRTLLKNTSFSVSAGEAVGVFGDSGSGKSVFSLFLLGFLDSSIFSFGALLVQLELV